MHEHILCPQQGLAISPISNVVLVHPGHKVTKVYKSDRLWAGGIRPGCLPLFAPGLRYKCVALAHYALQVVH